MDKKAVTHDKNAFYRQSSRDQATSSFVKGRSFFLLVLILLALCIAGVFITLMRPHVTPFAAPVASHATSPMSLPAFLASVDTMKESRDTETHQLSVREIASIVKLSASVNANYITVDTHWDYADYIRQWVDAIRAEGRHVWFRIQPNQWENANGASGFMDTEQYKQAEYNFIKTYHSFFQAGDILDPCPEPEQGHYWAVHYTREWTASSPNTATEAYNAFLRETTDVADSALHEQGINGVVTFVRSINAFFATNSNVLEQATVNKFGRITVDSYPEQQLTDPKRVVQARLSELQTIENTWHVPIIIGEMGYSNDLPVDDAVQQTVLKAEFAALAPLPFLIGVNYWVGPGANGAGGYTYIFVNSGGEWSFRPAAYELTAFYKTMVSRKASFGGLHGTHT